MRASKFEIEDILERAKKALSVYSELHGGIFQDDEEIMVSDFLADLMHVCDDIGADFHYCLRIAQDHYKEER